MISDEYERSSSASSSVLAFPHDVDSMLSLICMSDKSVQVESKMAEDILATKVRELQRQNLELVEENDRAYYALENSKSEVATLTKRIAMLMKSTSSFKEELRVSRQSVELQISLLQQGEEMHLDEIERYRHKNKSQASEILILRSRIEDHQDEIKELENQITLKNHLLLHSSLATEEEPPNYSVVVPESCDAHASCIEEIKKLRANYMEAEQKIRDLEDELNCMMVPNGRLHRTPSSVMQSTTGVCLLQEIKSLMSLTASVLSLHHNPHSPPPPRTPLTPHTPMSMDAPFSIPSTPHLHTTMVNNNSILDEPSNLDTVSCVFASNEDCSSRTSSSSSSSNNNSYQNSPSTLRRRRPISLVPLASFEEYESECATRNSVPPELKEKEEANSPTETNCTTLLCTSSKPRRTKPRNKLPRCFTGFRECIWGAS